MLIYKGIENIINDLINNTDSWLYRYDDIVGAMVAQKDDIKVWYTQTYYADDDIRNAWVSIVGHEIDVKSHFETIKTACKELEKLQQVWWEAAQKARQLEALKEGGWIK